MNLKTDQLKTYSTGFTLIELMVAIAIFAVLAALSYSGLNSTLQNTRLAENAIQNLRTMQLAVLVIERDINQIINRTIRDEYGDIKGAVSSGNGFDSILELTRSGWSNPADQPRSNLQRVSYVLEDGTLYRDFWTVLDRPNDDSAKIRTLLLENIEKFTIRYLDQTNDWYTQWPPVGRHSGFTFVPIAIEITLKLETFTEIKRLFKLPLGTINRT